MVILMLFVSMTVHAGNILDGCQDAMYFRTTKTDSPNNVELSLFLKNSSFAIKSLQCTIVLPQGVSFVTEGSDYKITKTDAIDSNWTLMARHKTGDPDNSAIVLLYNDSNTDQIATGNRKVASIPLTLSAPDALNGTGIYIKDVTLTGPDLTEYSGASYAFNFYTLTYLVDGVEYKTEDLKAGDAIIPTPAPTREGHTFTGWSDVPEAMPAGNVDIIGSFLVNKYTLTYMVDGVIYSQDSIAYGETITVKDEPVREGKSFSGWTEVPETMPSNDVIISGTFETNSYAVKYYVDGNLYQTVKYPFGTEIVALAEPTKTGYTFSGWSDIPATMPAQDVEISGSFSINSYVLTYKVDDVIYKIDTLAFASRIVALTAPTKVGYTFSGWSDIPAAMPAQDIEISGSFSINTYSLVYKVDGKEYKTVAYKYLDTIMVETTPVRTGYTFSGWSEIPIIMPDQDVQITGTFSINSYVLSYVVDGKNYRTDTLKYNAAIIALDAPTKDGYTFSGWSNIPTVMPANDVVISGTFDIIKYRLTYMLDGTVYRQDSIEFGTLITLIDDPKREGETFNGWVGAPETMPSHDVIINGTFAKNRYSVTYLVDGSTFETVSYLYGSEISAIANPTKEGYTFSGWGEIPATMPAHDVEISGMFIVNRYRLTYMVDGVVHSQDSVAFGDSIKVKDEPTLAGETFSGWVNAPETMPSHDVIISGTFDANSYNIRYYVDGQLYQTVLCIYGVEIVKLAEPTKEGYTFSGWSEIPTLMPAQDVVVSGSFNVNKYRLTYMVDGTIYSQDSIAYGDTIKVKDDPKRVGETFSGWVGAPVTMPSQDVVITGKFDINSYSVKYYVDGQLYQEIIYLKGAEITAIAEPKKEGYTFSGWSEIPPTMPASDVEILGSFKINTYSLTYMVDGSLYSQDSLQYGTVIKVIDKPEREGHTFSGWVNVPDSMPSHDVVISGTFDANNYSVKYYVDGVLYQTETYRYGFEITALAAPQKEGYTFGGWSDIPELMPAMDVEITGSFSINSYILTYMVDGEMFKKDTLQYNSVINTLNVPSKEGYTFSGWSNLPGVMPARNVEAVGAYIINKYALIYMVDGTVYRQDSIEYNAEIKLIEEPSLEGYSFSGWSDVADRMPSHDVVTSGTFSVNNYQVKYYVDGTVYQTVIYPFGSEIVALAEPTKVGYTFSGWSDIPGTMPSNDIEITGRFLVNSYIITYMVEGEVYKTDTVNYNSVIKVLSAPSKVGYTFSGWSDMPNNMPAENLVVVGSFSINSYNLVYKVDGKEYKTVTYKYNDTITVEPEPFMEGYTFMGWSDIPATMPAQNVEVVGLFSINSYILTYIIDGEVYKTDTIEFDHAIAALDAPVKEGYTFTGWSDMPEYMPSEDVEVIGTYVVNIYQLVVMIDGKIVFSDSIAYGTRLADYVDLIIQKGIDITQWELYDKIETITMPAHDVIINAVLNAVRPVMPDVEDDVIYDLTGRRIEVDDISTLPSGIYIRNGRKIVIR